MGKCLYFLLFSSKDHFVIKLENNLRTFAEIRFSKLFDITQVASWPFSTLRRAPLDIFWHPKLLVTFFSKERFSYCRWISYRGWPGPASYLTRWCDLFEKRDPAPLNVLGEMHDRESTIYLHEYLRRNLVEKLFFIIELQLNRIRICTHTVFFLSMCVYIFKDSQDYKWQTIIEENEWRRMLTNNLCLSNKNIKPTLGVKRMKAPGTELRSLKKDAFLHLRELSQLIT